MHARPCVSPLPLSSPDVLDSLFTLVYIQQMWEKRDQGTAPQLLPTVTGFAARQAVVLLRRHNIAAHSLLHALGFSEHELARTANDRDAVERRFSAAAQARFLEQAAEAMDDSAFGLHLAERSDPRDAGILFYVASGGKDIGEALALFARYLRIVNEAVRLKLMRTPQGAPPSKSTLSALRGRALGRTRNSSSPSL